MPGMGRLCQGFQHVQRDVLNAVPEQELLAAGEALHRRHQSQEEAVVRFERRPRPARAVLGGSLRRRGLFGSPIASHGSCSPLTA